MKKVIAVLSTICCIISIQAQTVWESFDTANTELKSNVINQIYQDSQDNMWFATEGGGVTMFNNTRWITYTTADGLASDYVYQVFEDSKNNYWLNYAFYRELGITKFDGTNWETFDVTNNLLSNVVIQLFEDSKGTLWFVYSPYDNAGISSYDGLTWKNYTTNEGLCSNAISYIFEDTQDNIWILSQGQGMMCYREGTWVKYDTSNALEHIYIEDILIDSKGDIWYTYPYWHDDVIDSPWSLTKYNTTGWETFRFDSITTIFNNLICKDSNSNIWVATNRGIFKYDFETWILYNQDPAIMNKNFTGIDEDTHGNLWINSNDGAIRYDGINWTLFGQGSQLEYDQIQNIYCDSKGRVWFLFNTIFYTDAGITQFDGSEWITYKKANGLLSDYIMSIFEDHDGNIWLATDKGLNKYIDPTGINNYTDENQLFTVFPNPARNKSVISYLLNEPGYVNVSLYDIHGRLIRSFINGQQDPGYYEIQFVSSENATGLLMCVLEVNGKIVSSKKLFIE